MNRGAGRNIKLKLYKRLGQPPAGMAWCSGYEKPPHQASIGDMVPKTMRCKACVAEYRHSEQVKRQAKRRGFRPQGSHGDPDVRPIEPGRVPPSNNEGKGLVFPSWGYGATEAKPGRNHRPDWFGLAA